MPILDVHRQVRGADLRVHADASEVVTVERDVERAKRFFEFQQLMQALGDPYATGVDADHQQIALEHRAQLLDHARHGGVDVDRHRHGESPGSSFRKACRMVWAATLSRRDLWRLMGTPASFRISRATSVERRSSTICTGKL